MFPRGLQISCKIGEQGETEIQAYSAVRLMVKKAQILTGVFTHCSENNLVLHIAIFKYFTYTHCPKSSLNICLKTRILTDGADSTVYVCRYDTLCPFQS